MKEYILIVDFGSQYTQLIARRVREHNVYCEIHPYDNIPKDIKYIKGIILSGSPYSIHDDKAPHFSYDRWSHLPILGICYGGQYIAKLYGCKVEKSKIREYGRANLNKVKDHPLFEGIDKNSTVWMSHADSIIDLGVQVELIASTKNAPCVGFQVKNKKTYGIQFHPEVTHTRHGSLLLKNFLVKICGCQCDWTPTYFIEATTKKIKEQIGGEHVILGLSGGVDSSVVALLLKQAIGDQLECIFVDNGLLRKGEYESVLKSYQNLNLNVVGIDAKEFFLNALKDIKDPEEKRKTIGKMFIKVFEQEAKKHKSAKWLAQGTIYPDVIESISVNGPSATIKSHHNVGGLPEKMDLKIVEPLKLLFKDEVRLVGDALDLPHHILYRHPFPGPGLAIRILGDVTKEKVRILQEVDDIFIKALKKENHYHKIWQALAILLPVYSVGVMGDERTYEQVVALRAVESVDGMTADFSHLPHEFLARVSNSIINKVKGINRVVYDISSKPPSTIEWE